MTCSLGCSMPVRLRNFVAARGRSSVDRERQCNISRESKRRRITSYEQNICDDSWLMADGPGKVVRQLSKRGYRAEAPTLPGHGPGAMRLGIAHQDCVRSVISYIQQQRLKQVVLVGHSFGGSVIQKVAEEIPGLIERTVFLDALIVEHGHSVFDELPAEYVALFNDLAQASSDNTMLIPWEVWRDNFI